MCTKLGTYTVNEPIKCTNTMLGSQMCTKQGAYTVK